jgi:hypothetical protein
MAPVLLIARAIMLKLNILREQINNAIPWAKSNPDKLETRIRKGNLVASGCPGASFEYRYYIDVLAMDYPADIDTLSLAILNWARDHQPDLLFNPDKRAREIGFDADILDNGNVDVLFTFPVSEATMVEKDANGKVIFIPRDEPDYRKLYGTDPRTWSIEFEGNITDEWL